MSNKRQGVCMLRYKAFRWRYGTRPDNMNNAQVGRVNIEHFVWWTFSSAVFARIKHARVLVLCVYIFIGMIRYYNKLYVDLTQLKYYSKYIVLRGVCVCGGGGGGGDGNDNDSNNIKLASLQWMDTTMMTPTLLYKKQSKKPRLPTRVCQNIFVHLYLVEPL